MRDCNQNVFKAQFYVGPKKTPRKAMLSQACSDRIFIKYMGKQKNVPTIYAI